MVDEFGLMAVGDDVHERDGFLVELVIVNVGGIFLVDRHRMRAEDFAFHHQVKEAR